MRTPVGLHCNRQQSLRHGLICILENRLGIRGFDLSP
jgi:hypothetical protein